jgi:hypothetical protein
MVVVLGCTVPKIWYIYSQKWNCAASFPNFYTHVSRSDLYIPMIGLIWNIYFPVLCEITLGSTTEAEKEGQGITAKQWLFAFPWPALPSCSWAKGSFKWPRFKFSIWKITDHKLKQVIFVINFLFGLRVNFKYDIYIYWILTGPLFAVWVCSCVCDAMELVPLCTEQQ